ncbi:MAG: response regulator [Anaerolineae bacterium]
MTDKNDKKQEKDEQAEDAGVASRADFRKAIEARKAREESRRKDKAASSADQPSVMASRAALERARAARLAREKKKGGGEEAAAKEPADQADPDATDAKKVGAPPAAEKHAVTQDKAAEVKPSTEEKAGGDGAKPSAEARRRVSDPAEAHVLVVEDNVPNFVLIARLLAYMGIQRCEWKTSGWQVVEFADTLPRIDLILMDIRLPYEDGYQALEKVRSNPRLKETLVIAVTAEASAEQMKKAREAGFDGFLAKPLNPDRFPEQIKRVLRGEEVWELT